MLTDMKTLLCWWFRICWCFYIRLWGGAVLERTSSLISLEYVIFPAVVPRYTKTSTSPSLKPIEVNKQKGYYRKDFIGDRIFEWNPFLVVCLELFDGDVFYKKFSSF